MAADYTGINKALHVMGENSFTKLSVRKRSNVLFSIDQGYPEDMIDRFKDWAAGFKREGVNDYQVLTVELTKKKGEDPIRFTFSFEADPFDNQRSVGNAGKPSDNILIDYGKLQSDNASLRARIVILENDLLEAENEIIKLEQEQEDNEIGSDQPEYSDGMMGAFEKAITPILPDLLASLVQNMKAGAKPTNLAGVGDQFSIQDCVHKLQELDPAFQDTINKLLQLRLTNPEAYTSALTMVEGFIKK